VLILGGNQLAGGFDVDNSVRYNGSNDSMNRTFAAGNQKTWTWSMWIKRSKLSVDQTLFGRMTSTSDSGWFNMSLNSDDTITFGIYNTNYRKTNRKFRDISAWYHIVLAFDTTQGTAANRIKFYINGVEETSFSTSNDPSQNFDSPFNANAVHSLGIQPIPSGYEKYYGGYISEVTFIDGLQLGADSFGEFDEDTGIWKPIDVSGLTFGTNGFYLDFENSGSLGADVSGNGNNFTVNNLTSIDKTTDTPTNNFATLNSILPLFSSSFSEGNCKWTPSTASQYYWVNSTIGLSQGKWYMEAKLTTAADHNYIGIASDEPEDSTTYLAGGGGTGDANDAYQWGYKSSSGQVFNNASGSAYGNTYTTGDIIGMYLDLDNNKLYFAKNGTIQNSGTGVSITDPGSVPTGVYFPCVADGTSSNSSVWEVNFGNPTFTISSGNSDPNGYGNFEYDPSAGTFDGVSKNFYALNTKNLAEYG
jgi:hypothetical protein